ncbi:MAG: hypothetical protein IJU52_00035 [Clostridia bacterium]|nr:hypothetical protein [Clostridia bacterium]
MTRKIALLLLIPFFAATLAGCASAPTPTLPASPFEAEVAVAGGGARGTFRLKTGEDRTVTLTSGEGTVYSYGESGAFVRAGGLTLPLSPALLPDRGLLGAALFPRDDAAPLRGSATVNGKKYVSLTYVGKEGNFVCLFDETGTLARIDREGSPEYTFEFTFGINSE